MSPLIPLHPVEEKVEILKKAGGDRKGRRASENKSMNVHKKHKDCGSTQGLHRTGPYGVRALESGSQHKPTFLT